MKRLGQIWPDVIDFDNLLTAYRKARRGKRRSPDVAAFALDLEGELLTLQCELADQTYRPGEYRLFTIYERKKRHIAAAPFRDRVVHHAILNVIEPTLDRRFIHDSYACRKGKGVHAAVDRYQQWSKRYPYVLKMDIEQYFPSIDHKLLKTKLRRHIKDASLLALLDQIVDGAPTATGRHGHRYFLGDDLFTPLDRPTGLPIGNLTSQFFANLYLDEFDHFIKQQLKVRPYLRYVDDLIVLGRDKGQLHEISDAIKSRLSDDRLCLHPQKAHIYHIAHGVDIFGYQVFPTKRRLRSDNGHAFRRKLRRQARLYCEGLLNWNDIQPSVNSWIGHAIHGETHGLRRKIFAATVFTRG
ncbi:MAG: reverse transcriptase/maturase family protein [Candidatus Thiodiazotropha sp. (ex. Lucinisca nassula)]|nr:reverse transcriptase/maturase family protein [Candidatus Thiodiazotropha sp. (ex. Lucinisca nassula)]MBW9273058.1 reverse transcriptase/maturase family protein [Candidatus Thiodiazotropha sp. (ex. Lucinisca nassula)]